MLLEKLDHGQHFRVVDYPFEAVPDDYGCLRAFGGHVHSIVSRCCCRLVVVVVVVG